jgi:Flp pilus assembly secretin CpaC
MAALMGRCRQWFGIWPLVLLAAAAVAGSAPARADTLSINVDQAQIMHLPEKIATIVIGNPLIADATLQSGGILVVTGKGYGATNLLALDRSGRVVMEKTVQVLGAGTGDLVTVYRGVERESYSCAPNCERRITLGDSPGYFNATLTESGARNGQAATAAPH